MAHQFLNRLLMRPRNLLFVVGLGCILITLVFLGLKYEFDHTSTPTLTPPAPKPTMVSTSTPSPVPTLQCLNLSPIHLHAAPKEGGTISRNQIVYSNSDPKNYNVRPQIGELGPTADGEPIKAFISFNIEAILKNVNLTIQSAKLDLSEYGDLSEVPGVFRVMGPVAVDTVYYGNEGVQPDLYEHNRAYSTVYLDTGVPDDPIDVTSAVRVAYRNSYKRFQISIYFTGPPQRDKKLERIVFDDTGAGVELEVEGCLP